jgi:hypothetical protein
MKDQSTRVYRVQDLGIKDQALLLVRWQGVSELSYLAASRFVSLADRDRGSLECISLGLAFLSNDIIRGECSNELYDKDDGVTTRTHA